MYKLLLFYYAEFQDRADNVVYRYTFRDRNMSAAKLHVRDVAEELKAEPGKVYRISRDEYHRLYTPIPTPDFDRVAMGPPGD